MQSWEHPGSNALPTQTQFYPWRSEALLVGHAGVQFLPIIGSLLNIQT